VSTQQQDLTRQIKALKREECDVIYADTASGTWSADRNLPAPSMTSTPAAVGTAPGLEDHHVDRPEVKAAQAVPRCFCLRVDVYRIIFGHC
jgi:hypothetical protein